MKQEIIIKRDSDRKTEINRVIVNVPTDLKEMYEWILTDKSSEMEKYIIIELFLWSSNVQSCIHLCTRIESIE